MPKVLKKNFDVIFFSFVGFILITWNKLFICQMPVGLGFDEQSFLYWNHTSLLHLVPFKDFFYPYGLLFFFKTDNMFWYGVSLLLSFVSIATVYLIFKQILGKRIITYIFFASFCVFVSMFLSYDSIVRYAPLIAVSYIISYLSTNKLLHRKTYLLIVGLILGLLFSFINDVFFYSIILFVSSFFLYLFNNKKLFNKELVLPITFLLIGFFVGILPFAYYIYVNNALDGLINNYNLLKSVSLFAKVPFPPSLKYFENVFIIGILIISIISLIVNVKDKEKKDFIFYMKFCLVILLLALEQKNIIRPFYQELSTLSFLLFLILLGEAKSRIENLKINKLKINLSVFLIICIFMMLISYERRTVQSGDIVKMNIFKTCSESKIDVLKKYNISEYLEVVRMLRQEKNVKIFSFPGDPIFYILFDQAPPYYPSVYESTPYFAQRKQIEYLKNENVNFIIYNTKSFAIQDGVPDKIRSKKLYGFISDNFKPVKKVGDFEILEKD